MKKTMIALLLLAASSNASASEGLPLWLAALIAFARQHVPAHHAADRHDRR